MVGWGDMGVLRFAEGVLSEAKDLLFVWRAEVGGGEGERGGVVKRRCVIDVRVRAGRERGRVGESGARGAGGAWIFGWVVCTVVYTHQHCASNEIGK